MNFENRIRFIPQAHKGFGQLTLDDYILNETTLYENMAAAFDETVTVTLEWLQTPAAIEYFIEQGGRLSTFMNNSGIREQWQSIIDNRASRGADITEQIYDYARKVNMEDYLVPYTSAEKLAMNKLCDNTYELIRSVTNDQITSIRRHLIQDYAEGVNPRQTSLKEALEQIQLEPINGLSPQERAEMIARTESARALNTSTLETYKADGITMVSLYNPDQCDECAEYNTPTPIAEAIEIGVVHPNCRCTWIPETEIQ